MLQRFANENLNFCRWLDLEDTDYISGLAHVCVHRGGCRRWNLIGKNNHEEWFRKVRIIPDLSLCSLFSLSFPTSPFLFFCLLFLSVVCSVYFFFFLKAFLLSISLMVLSTSLFLVFLSISSSSTLLSPFVSFCPSVSLSTLSFFLDQTRWAILLPLYSVSPWLRNNGTKGQGMKPGHQINPPPSKFLSQVSCYNYGKLESHMAWSNYCFWIAHAQIPWVIAYNYYVHETWLMLHKKRNLQIT